MLNHREPISEDIVEYIIDKGKYLYKANPDNICSALGDWPVLGE